MALTNLCIALEDSVVDSLDGIGKVSPETILSQCHHTLSLLVSIYHLTVSTIARIVDLVLQRLLSQEGEVQRTDRLLSVQHRSCANHYLHITTRSGQFQQWESHSTGRKLQEVTSTLNNKDSKSITSESLVNSLCSGNRVELVMSGVRG